MSDAKPEKTSRSAAGSRRRPGRTSGATQNPTREPGREGATVALVAAARELFSEYGPNGVSLRDVAQEAGVSHGLIHHYIGSRDDLLRRVFEAATEQARHDVETFDDPVEAVRSLRDGHRDGDYDRLLAWALLEGFEPLSLQGTSSALDTIAEASGADSPELRMAIASAMVGILGWKLFGTYAVTASGLAESDLDAAREAFEGVIDDAIRRAATR